MNERPIKIAVMALGGQGGGVLAGWIVEAGERAGFIAQATSVPGVAQRTGATIYYVELFPKAAADAKGRAPVLALTPTPGDVDIVIAAEMMEAGRAVLRGFVSKETTLIASTHRIYAIGEKIELGDGRKSAGEARRAADAAAGRAIWFDMDAAAGEAGAVISAVLFGALAGSGATPIARADFEETIRQSGRAVERNLKGFALGYDAASTGAPIKATDAPPALAAARDEPAPAVAGLAARLSTLPSSVRDVARLGLARVVDFQDPRYGALYLDRLERIVALDLANGGETQFFRLSAALAKHLALFMAYEDVVRVADLKTRASRFRRCREDVRAGEDQIVRLHEYMHPRVEEFCDLAPSFLARAILASPFARRAVTLALGGGKRVATTSLRGFLLLNTLASMRFMRRASYRYGVEQARIENWLGLIAERAPRDYALACEIVGLQRLLKGYGETHERGLANFERILGSIESVRGEAEPAKAVARLRDSALKDEAGAALAAELSRLGATAAA